MKRMRRIALLTAALAVVNLGTACIHKAGGAQVSPYERAVTYSTMLAQVNNSVVQGVIQAQQAGLMTAQQAESILQLENGYLPIYQR